MRFYYSETGHVVWKRSCPIKLAQHCCCSRFSLPPLPRLPLSYAHNVKGKDHSSLVFNPCCRFHKRHKCTTRTGNWNASRERRKENWVIQILCMSSDSFLRDIILCHCCFHLLLIFGALFVCLFLSFFLFVTYVSVCVFE